MKIILTEKEKKVLRHLQYIGTQREYKVYDDLHGLLLFANMTILCGCGKKFCEHKKLLLLKLLKEYKVRKDGKLGQDQGRKA